MIPADSPDSIRLSKRPSSRSSTGFAPETSSSRTTSPSSTSCSLAQPVILSRCTLGEMYDSPFRPATLDTRMYPSIAGMKHSLDHQLTIVKFLDEYRIELVEL